MLARIGLGSARIGDGRAEMEARIGLGSKRTGDGIAQTDALIRAAAAFFIDPAELRGTRVGSGELNRNTKGEGGWGISRRSYLEAFARRRPA